jgi:hypothetical protein
VERINPIMKCQQVSMTEHRFELSLRAFLRDRPWFIVSDAEAAKTPLFEVVKMDCCLCQHCETRLLISPYSRRLGTGRTDLNTQDPEASVKPPRRAEFLLYLFLPKKWREVSLGDLNEDYQEVYRKFGPKPAAVWYYKQVISSLCPVVFRAIWKGIKWVGMGWAAVHSLKKSIGR